MNIISVVLSVITLLFLLQNPVSANSDIHVSSDIVYQYSPSGKCQVTHHITLTNGPTHVYPSSFQLDISGLAPEELQVTNSAGPLKYVYKNLSSSNSQIVVYLSDPVVGKSGTQQLSVSYLCLPAVNRGQIWEIVLPKINDSNFYDQLNIRIDVPDSFGSLAFMDPPPRSIGSHSYIIDKSRLGNGTVNAVFGKFQTYAFTITYPLSNTTAKQQLQSIYLPSDSSYQKVFIEKLVPGSENVRVDEFGNWLADIRVPPKSQIQFIVAGQVHLLPSPSSLSLIPANHSLSRRIIGFSNNHLIDWDEQWDSLQSAWVASDPHTEKFHVCTEIPSCRSQLSTAKLSLFQTEFKEYSRSTPQFSWKQPFQIIPFFINHSQLEITNTQPQALYWFPVTISTGSFNLKSPSAYHIPVIPPFGKVVLPINFSFSPLPKLSIQYWSLRAGTSLLTYNLPSYLFTSWHVIFILITTTGFIGVAWVAVRSWSLHIQRRKRDNNIRRQSQKP